MTTKQAQHKLPKSSTSQHGKGWTDAFFKNSITQTKSGSLVLFIITGDMDYKEKIYNAISQEFLMHGDPSFAELKTLAVEKDQALADQLLNVEILNSQKAAEWMDITFPEKGGVSVYSKSLHILTNLNLATSLLSFSVPENQSATVDRLKTAAESV